MPSGTTRLGAVCQPALSSPSTTMRSRPAPASRANSASSAAKNGLDTPFDTYQNTSPEIGCTKAVTYRWGNGPGADELRCPMVVPRLGWKYGVRVCASPKHRWTEDDHGALCRFGRVLERDVGLHRGWGGHDHPRDEGGLRA